MVSAGKFSRMKSCFQPHSREWSIQRLLSILFYFFPFLLLFFLPPRVKQAVESDSSGWQFHSSWAFGRLLICLSGWMYLTVQVLWADAVVGVWWAGWRLLKYHGQGPLHTCPDHPWLHLSGVLYVGSSAQPWPFAGIITWDSSSLGAFERAAFPVNPCSKTLGIPQCVSLYSISSIWQ